MTTRCVVVIGHVDHGKTALVRAVTGIETDRLAEEKARGLTITLGYAHRRYDAGSIDFIDAPGHADFVQTMVAGATGAVAALLVISATDGPQEQTLEHLQIAGLLGIERAVVAVTKMDLVAEEDREARLSEIASALVPTPFAKAPLVPCAAQTGEGLGALNAELEALLTEPPAVATPRSSFLPIDRVFTLPGRGTIVTGTLLGDDLTMADDIALYPAQTPAPLRGLHCRGASAEQVTKGSRVAVNLRNLTVTDLARGDVLGTVNAFVPSRCVDVSLNLLPGQRVKHMQELRLLFGTTSTVAQLRLYSADPAFAQLRFPTAICGFAGQRAILRRLSPAETLGAATFLDPCATPTRAGDTLRLNMLQACGDGDPQAIATALCDAQDGIAALPDIARLSRRSIENVTATLASTFNVIADDLLAPTETIKAAEADLMARLSAYHQTHPLHSMAPRAHIMHRGWANALQQHIERSLQAQGKIRSKGQRLALATHDPSALLTPQQRDRMDAIANVFHTAGLAPPSPETILLSAEDRDLFDLLTDTGQIITLQNVALKQSLSFHADTLSQAAAILAASFPAPQSFATGEARRVLNTTRRIIVPLLEHFDSIGFTKRTGDTRQLTR